MMLTSLMLVIIFRCRWPNGWFPWDSYARHLVQYEQHLCGISYARYRVCMRSYQRMTVPKTTKYSIDISNLSPYILSPSVFNNDVAVSNLNPTGWIQQGILIRWSTVITWVLLSDYGTWGATDVGCVHKEQSFARVCKAWNSNNS